MSTQPESLLHACTRIYRAVVADAGVDTISRKEALDELVTVVTPLVATGVVVVDADDAIRRVGMAVDDADGRRADAVLRAAARGEDNLDLEGDPVLDLVTVLGDGMRKAWRHVTAGDLREMDQVRYRNMRQSSDAYDRWRRDYEPWLAVLFRHPTLGDAVLAGDLPDTDEAAS